MCKKSTIMDNMEKIEKPKDSASPTEAESKNIDMLVRHNIDFTAHAIQSKNGITYPEALEAIREYADYMTEQWNKAIKNPTSKREHGGGLDAPLVVPGKEDTKLKIVYPDHLAYAVDVIQNDIGCGYVEGLNELKKYTVKLLDNYERMREKRDKK